MHRSLTVFLVLGMFFGACKSPLDIDTEREKLVQAPDSLSLVTGNRVSIGIAFDASGSMLGAPCQAAKAGALRLLEYFDGDVDEAAVVWFHNNRLDVPQSMTNNLPALRSAVLALPANGVTAIWDVAAVAIEEVIRKGAQSSRGVVIVTDGRDNWSAARIDSIVTAAMVFRIPLHIVEYGDGDTGDALRRIALETQGGYYRVATESASVSAFLSILCVLRKSPGTRPLHATPPDAGKAPLVSSMHGCLTSDACTPAIPEVAIQN
jgi:hypothetical protein